MYCQKCKTPLRLDSTLRDLNPAAFDLLVGSSSKSPQPSKTSTFITPQFNYPQERKELHDWTSQSDIVPIHKRTLPPPPNDGDAPSRLNPGGVDMSFIEITESQIVPELQPQSRPVISKTDTSNAEKNENSLPAQVRKAEQLFSILSSHSDIDHPICAECTSILLTAFNTRLQSAMRERDAYASFLKALQQASASDKKDGTTDAELDKLKNDEETAFGELRQLEEEKKQLELELAELEEEEQKLEIEEEEFWAARNVFDQDMNELTTNLASLQQKYVHDQERLDKLQRTNVYNDTFCIGHDGYFGTINGLRLGRLPLQNVEWAEINAAWGQTLLLLATVAERLGMIFQGYRLRPLGSTSRIEKLEWPQQAPEISRGSTATNPPPKVTSLDLFSSGEMALGRVWNYRRFDAGMVAFLECLRQVGEHVEKIPNPNTRSMSRTKLAGVNILPYKIQDDKIDGVSIKLGVGFQHGEDFTKACKYALTCCKFLLAYVSNMENPK